MRIVSLDPIATGTAAFPALCGDGGAEKAARPGAPKKAQVPRTPRRAGAENVLAPSLTTALRNPPAALALKIHSPSKTPQARKRRP